MNWTLNNTLNITPMNTVIDMKEVYRDIFGQALHNVRLVTIILFVLLLIDMFVLDFLKNRLDKDHPIADTEYKINPYKTIKNTIMMFHICGVAYILNIVMQI